jgi:hypothetical protein
MLGQQTVSPDRHRPDRRAHRRFMASELHGLRTARVKYGREVGVIDLSEGGVLFETADELKPDTTIVLEFAGPSKTVLVPSRVVRCQSLPTIDETVRSEGACAFRRPLALVDLVGDTSRLETSTATPGTRSTESLWLQVVGKYRDGRLVRGYTNDFDPLKPYLHVSPTPAADEAQFVSMIQLDALFFVRDARAAARGDVDAAAQAEAATQGRKVAMALPNGKELIGVTLNYTRDGSGFFVHPLDSYAGAVRVFVTQSGIRNVRFL